MSHASLIWGYAFSRQELVKASKIKELTPENLEKQLREQTSRLDLEWYYERNSIYEVNLRTGHSNLINNDCNKDYLNRLYFLVGTCLADIDCHEGILDIKRIIKNELTNKELIKTIVKEFRESFPKQEWKAGNLSQMLMTEMYSRSIRSRRDDYPILKL